LPGTGDDNIYDGTENLAKEIHKKRGRKKMDSFSQ